jgi:urate oxidase
MTVILAENSYGKSRVRLLKVRRDGARHTVHEWEVAIRFEGDFEAAHRDGDNALILPTDTMKNTVYAKAADTAATTPEAFGLELAGFFLDRNEVVSRVGVDIVETPWTRWPDGKGKPHDHAFVAGGTERRLASVDMDRMGVHVMGGLADLLVMKTARSAFFGYPRDPYTTLPETRDRIFRTVIAAEWSWAGGGAAFERFEAARRLLLDTFAAHDSRSVQETLYAMGEAVLDGVTEIDDIRLSLPNQHCLPIDMARFGMENRNEIFVVTEEPHGLIEATLRRD